LRRARYLLLLATLSGCATPSAQAPAPTAAGGGGTILLMRDVNAPSGGEPWRTVLLSDSGGRDRDRHNLVEFIVRADDGATLSIVQSNELGFRTGDRVVIVHDGQTRLARSG